MTPEQQHQIEKCYADYCEIIKPLIAQIEASSEKLPLPLFNEIRAFNDHIARCYYNSPAEDYIAEQIDKAQRHITRITLDCFKCLNVILYQKIELFERQTRNVDLTVIDNGTFFLDYSRMKVQAASLVEQAKILEFQDVDKALYKYQGSFNLYSDIVSRINSITEKVKWARVRFRVKRCTTVIAWIASVVISAIISAIFSCKLISTLIGE